MKRLTRTTASILTLLICLLFAALPLSACAPAQSTVTDDYALPDDVFVSMGPPAYFNLENYEKVANKLKKQLPNFVEWDDISMLGDFHCFQPIYDNDSAGSPPTWYQYVLHDESKNELLIWILTDREDASHLYADTYKSTEITSDMTSMRALPFCPDKFKASYVHEKYPSGEDFLVIERNGMEYRYCPNGLIKEIVWKINGNVIIIHHNSCYTYSNSYSITSIAFSTPFYEQLLSVSEDEASAAFETLRNNLMRK